MNADGWNTLVQAEALAAALDAPGLVVVDCRLAHLRVLGNMFSHAARGTWADRTHAPYRKRPASAKHCRKIDKKTNRLAVAFLLDKVANRLWRSRLAR